MVFFNNFKYQFFTFKNEIEKRVFYAYCKRDIEFNWLSIFMGLTVKSLESLYRK